MVFEYKVLDNCNSYLWYPPHIRKRSLLFSRKEIGQQDYPFPIGNNNSSIYCSIRPFSIYRIGGEERETVRTIPSSRGNTSSPSRSVVVSFPNTKRIIVSIGIIYNREGIDQYRLLDIAYIRSTFPCTCFYNSPLGWFISFEGRMMNELLISNR